MITFLRKVFSRKKKIAVVTMSEREYWESPEGKALMDTWERLYDEKTAELERLHQATDDPRERLRYVGEMLQLFGRHYMCCGGLILKRYPPRVMS